MNSESSQTPSEKELRFKEAMRRILSLTPEQREEVKRKMAAEERQRKATRKQPPNKAPRD